MENGKKRIICVGDVHGCYDEMLELLEKCSYNPEFDRLIFVGDLVAKGPKSLEVVRFCKDKKIECIMGNFEFNNLEGNHDEYILNWWKNKQEGIEIQLKEGHQKICNSLDESEWKYLESMPYWISIPDFNIIVVHAGLVPGILLTKQNLFDLTHMRNIDSENRASEDIKVGTPWTEHWKGPELIIYGHDAVRGLCIREHSVGLDTGCCYGGKLSALIYPSKEIIQVDAKQQYAPKTHM